MTTNGARRAFIRSYQIPVILAHYPRLIRTIQKLAFLDAGEAAACIRDFKAGLRWSGQRVNHYGGARKVVADAWSRRADIRSVAAI